MLRHRIIIALLSAVLLCFGVPHSVYAYTAPGFADSGFNSGAAEGNGSVRIDLSGTGQGYVAVSATSGNRLKFQVINGGSTYNYDLPNNGSPAVYPLQSGNGNYQFRVMENVVDNKYAELYSVSRSVSIADGFQPFLRPSMYVNYNAGSGCVRKAAELAAPAANQVEVVANVYNFVCSTVTYDHAKAASVSAGYLPVPDETMNSGRGICFDYAALTAAMLRSQGIPTKMIFGYVAPNNLYHAWNMFYTPETGWVTASFQVNPNNWNRIDLTFSANGADASFIGNGSNYSDLYNY